MNHWDHKFSSEAYLYGEEANQFVQEQFKDDMDQKVALFAEGEGRNAVYLARLGAKVTAYDYAQNGLDKAERLAHKYHVEIETVKVDLTIEDIVPKQQYDIALTIFGHIPSSGKATFFKNMLASLKPGGKLYFEVYSKNQLDYGTGGPKDVDMLYDVEEIEQLLNNFDVTIQRLEELEVERHEGDKHTGKCKVVQGIILNN